MCAEKALLMHTFLNESEPLPPSIEGDIFQAFSLWFKGFVRGCLVFSFFLLESVAVVVIAAIRRASNAFISSCYSCSTVATEALLLLSVLSFDFPLNSASSFFWS